MPRAKIGTTTQITTIFTVVCVSGLGKSLIVVFTMLELVVVVVLVILVVVGRRLVELVVKSSGCKLGSRASSILPYTSAELPMTPSCALMAKLN